jgi:hypothetical protein
MPDYAAPLQRLMISRTLWLILLWPILGAAWQMLVERRRPARGRSSDGSVGRGMALASLALATTATLAHIAILGRLPIGQRALFEPLTDGARIGQIDATLALWFDPLAAAGAALACLVALAAVLFAPPRLVRDKGWRAWTWIHLALVGALTAFLADGFVTTAVGWSVAALAGAWLEGWTDARAGMVAAMRGVVAICAMLLGAGLVFWGLGGGWEGDEFVSDVQPRFAAVRIGGWSSEVPSRVGFGEGEDEMEGRPGGTVTLTGAPGAQVFVDEARRRSLEAPFVRLPVLGGRHKFRIRRGEGVDDAVVGSVSFEDGVEIALEPLGPALAFRTIAAQLALRDRQGVESLQHALEARRAPGGITVVGGAFLAWIAAALAMSGWAPGVRVPRSLAAVACGATLVPLGPYFLARVASLAPWEPSPAMPIAAAGLAMLLFGCIRALLARSGAKPFLSVLRAAPAGIGCVAVGLWHGQWFPAAMTSIGFVVASAEIAAARGDWSGRMTPGPAPETGMGSRLPASALGELVLLGIPEAMGELLVSMERWVVDAVVGALATFAMASAWLLARTDEHVISMPAELLVERIIRGRRRVEPIVGTSSARILWALLCVAGLTALVLALWPGS